MRASAANGIQVVLAAVAILLPTYSRLAQNDSSSSAHAGEILAQRELFGIPLSAPATELLTKVEKHFRKQVREEEKTDWPPDKFGEAVVAPDGTPVIQINKSTGRTEENIVHELFHLKLAAEGWGQEVKFSGPREFMLHNEEFFRRIGGLLYAPITHLVFYPAMRKMGLNPSVEINADLKQKFQSGNHGSLEATTDKYRALYYVIAGLESDDPELLLRLSELYEKKGWSGPLEVAKNLTTIINMSKPTTKESATAVFLQCMQALFEGEAQFEFAGWEEERRGSGMQRKALFRVKPASESRQY